MSETKKIKVNVRFDERSQAVFPIEFDVVDSLPTDTYDGKKVKAIGSGFIIEPIEDNDFDIDKYDYYRIATANPKYRRIIDEYYVAMKKLKEKKHGKYYDIEADWDFEA